MNQIINYLYYYIPFKSKSITNSVFEIEYIVEIIAEFLKIKKTFTLLTVNKLLYSNDLIRKSITFKISSIYKYFSLWKKARVLKHFDSCFIPKSLLKVLPVLNFEQHYIGCSGYIDMINANNIDSPIMIGVDSFKRPFLTMKYKYIPDVDKPTHSWGGSTRGSARRYFKQGGMFPNEKAIKNNICYITIFQRYSNNKNLWVKCNYYSPILDFDNFSQITDEGKTEVVEAIKNLLTDKKISFKKGRYTTYHLIGYDYDKLNCTINNL